MNAKTMEGLAGASASMSLISTPMNVAKEAERKGDTDKMQRALGSAASRLRLPRRGCSRSGSWNLSVSKLLDHLA